MRWKNLTKPPIHHPLTSLSVYLSQLFSQINLCKLDFTDSAFADKFLAEKHSYNIELVFAEQTLHYFCELGSSLEVSNGILLLVPHLNYHVDFVSVLC